MQLTPKALPGHLDSRTQYLLLGPGAARRGLHSHVHHVSASLARLLGLTNSEVYKHGGDALEIRIKADKDSHTVVIE